MDNIVKTLIKGINHKQWIEIDYDNKEGNTRYWIGIRDYYYKKKGDIPSLVLIVDIFNPALEDGYIKNSFIYFNKILSAQVKIDTYFKDSLDLNKKISSCPDDDFLSYVPSIDENVLDYLYECSILDTSPYISNYTQILGIDNEVLKGQYTLSLQQFKKITKKLSLNKDDYYILDSLVMNEVSINTKKGLYVIAYRPLVLDVENRVLTASKRIMINRRFIFKDESGKPENEISAYQFLNEEDYYLLDDIDVTIDELKDALAKNVDGSKVDSSPHILSLAHHSVAGLLKEYREIKKSIDDDDLNYPLLSFFGKINTKPRRSVTYPISLISPANIDQLFVMYKALKFPVTYVQGPPGTGKTKTIINTIISAFFNNKTVLVSTNNNVPLDGIYDGLVNMKYINGKGISYIIPFPVLRLGNDENILKSLRTILNLVRIAESINSDANAIERVRLRYIKKTDSLNRIMEKYEEYKNLNEVKELLEDNSIQDAFSLKKFLFVDPQLDDVKSKLKEIGNIEDNQAEIDDLIKIDNDIFMYLYFESANKIKKLKKSKYSQLMNILHMDDDSLMLKEFKGYISDDDNLQALLKVFPVILTTNMSSLKLGSPTPHFDLTIMDEAGQCAAPFAISPIARGENLLLVGDPNQLKPVVQLDQRTNEILKEKFNIPSGYDFLQYSILDMFLNNDTVNEMILLRLHYRCDPKIISFNNKMFYNNHLKIMSKGVEQDPLVFIDIPQGTEVEKRNTCIEEVDNVLSYCLEHQNQKIGIITPFKNQRQLLIQEIEKNGLSERVSVGTVHEFQGDEQDVIIFSTAISKNTLPATYNWLKTNNELINVATSRAKTKLIMLANEDYIEQLHFSSKGDDYFYELYQYIKKKGVHSVSFDSKFGTRATGLKTYNSELERAFLDNLSQVIACNIDIDLVYKTQVPMNSIFNMLSVDETYNSFFFKSKFDFVLFRKGNDEVVAIIELNGIEHEIDEVVKKRDEIKRTICRNHNVKLIEISNRYARRYEYIKERLLTTIFKQKRK